MLTPEQVKLLGWIVTSGSGEVLHVPTGNDPRDVAIIPDGPRQMVSPADFRELIEQGLVRHVRGQLHEVTNEGRQTYERLRSPSADG